MSYTINLSDPITSAADLRTKGNDELNRLRESGATDEVIEAAKAAVAAAADLVGTRYFGPGPLKVQISGHANVQHNPSPEWANDFVTITISDARTADDLVNTSVTVNDDDAIASYATGVADVLAPTPGVDGDVEHPPAREDDELNTPYIEVEPDENDAAVFDALNAEGTVIDMTNDPEKTAPDGQDKVWAAEEAAKSGDTSVTILTPADESEDNPSDEPQGNAILSSDGHDVTVEAAGDQTHEVTVQQAVDAVEAGESQDADGNALDEQPKLEDTPKEVVEPKTRRK